MKVSTGTLADKKSKFSPIFYKRHFRHIVRVFVKIALWIIVSGAFAFVGLSQLFERQGSSGLAAISLAIFLWVLASTIFGSRDVLKVTVLPYFERRLGNINTFLAGEALLWNSRWMDELAGGLNIRPLSSFASGDDMVLGEKLSWFDPSEALNTTRALLSSEAAQSFSPELKSDLMVLQEALAAASASKVRFCLLLREGSFTSGAEMDQRKGSYF